MPMVSRDPGASHRQSPMERLWDPGKPPPGGRTSSLDRLQQPRMDAESGDARCLSLPTTPCGSLPAGSREGPARSADTGGSTAMTDREESCKEQFPGAQDSKKDKAQKSWLRNLLSFVLRPEEPKEKAGKKVKGREGLPSPAESPEDPELPVPGKKAPDKKGGRGRPEARETLGAREQDARGCEAGPPGKASTPHSEEVPRGPARRGRERSGYHHSVLNQSRRRQPEEELRKPDKDAVIQMVVEFLKKMAELCEKQNAAGNTNVTCPEARPSQSPTCLALPGRGHQPPTPSGSGLEGARVPEVLCSEAGDQGPVDIRPRQAKSRVPEEDLAQDRVSESKEAVIQMIVKFLQRVGDQYEIEQLQAPLPEVFEPNPAPPSKKRPPEKKTSLKRVFSLKKQGSEEPKRAGTAGAASPESRPPRRPTCLALCVGGQRPSTPSSSGLEEAGVPETLCPEGADLSPSDVRPRGANSRTPEEVLAQDTISESKEAVIQMIVKFLQRVGDQYEIEQLQAPLPEVFEPNPAPPSKKRPPEKKTSLKRVFSLKKQGSEEPKRAGAAGAASPVSRPPRRPTFLALCVGGQRPSIPSISDLDTSEFQDSSPMEGGQEVPSETAPRSQARNPKPERKPALDGASESKLLIIQKLEAFLQEVGEQLGEQIRRHPCLKKCFQELLDSCQEKLVLALRSQEGHLSHPSRNPAKGPYQFPFDLPNKFAGNSHNVISLLDLLGHYRRRRSSQYSYEVAQQNATSPDIQIESPD